MSTGQEPQMWYFLSFRVSHIVRTAITPMKPTTRCSFVFLSETLNFYRKRWISIGKCRISIGYRLLKGQILYFLSFRVSHTVRTTVTPMESRTRCVFEFLSEILIFYRNCLNFYRNYLSFLGRFLPRRLVYFLKIKTDFGRRWSTPLSVTFQSCHNYYK